MISGGRRLVVLAAGWLAAVGLVGCAGAAGGTPGTVDDCSPARPRVSADAVQPGDAVTVSVSAVACSPRFDDDRDLALVWVDHAGHRTQLATVEAHPSGAFEQEVRIPSTAAAGTGGIVVSGIEVPCADTGSCAAYEAAVTVVTSTPDFATPTLANQVATGIAHRMQKAIGHRAAYVGLAIVTDGIEVWMHTSSFDAETAAARAAFAAARAAAPASERAVAKGAHLRITFVQHGRHGLDRLRQRLLDDRPWQRAHDIEIVMWFADTATDSVRIAVRHYSDAAARQLLRRYGDAITVVPRHSEPARALTGRSVGHEDEVADRGSPARSALAPRVLASRERGPSSMLAS